MIEIQIQTTTVRPTPSEVGPRNLRVRTSLRAGLSSNVQKKMDDTVSGQQQKIG